MAALVLASGCSTTDPAIPVDTSAPADTADPSTEAPESPTPTPAPDPQAPATPEPTADTLTPAPTMLSAEPESEVPPLVELCESGSGVEETSEPAWEELEARTPEEALELYRPEQPFLTGVTVQPAERTDHRAIFDILLPDGALGGSLFFEMLDGVWGYVGGNYCSFPPEPS